MHVVPGPDSVGPSVLAPDDPALPAPAPGGSLAATVVCPAVRPEPPPDEPALAEPSWLPAVVGRAPPADAECDAPPERAVPAPLPPEASANAWLPRPVPPATPESVAPELPPAMPPPNAALPSSPVEVCAPDSPPFAALARL